MDVTLAHWGCWMSLGGLMMHIGLGRDQTCPIISASLVRGDPRGKHNFLLLLFFFNFNFFQCNCWSKGLSLVEESNWYAKVSTTDESNWIKPESLHTNTLPTCEIGDSLEWDETQIGKYMWPSYQLPQVQKKHHPIFNLLHELQLIIWFTKNPQTSVSPSLAIMQGDQFTWSYMFVRFA